MTSNSVASNNSVTSSSPSTQLEIYAQYERHMQGCDTLIAGRIGCSPAYWAGMRERNLPFWEQMEHKAMQTPPRLSAGQLAAQHNERYFAPGEYLRWSQRHPEPISRWDWFCVIAIALGILVFFGQQFIPELHDFLTSLFQ